VTSNVVGYSREGRKATQECVAAEQASDAAGERLTAIVTRLDPLLEN
jgi:hypothetical protein